MSTNKMSRRFYVLAMWQTGNIGSCNIAKVEQQPEDGFLMYRDAENWLEENIVKITTLWETFIITMVYEKTKIEKP